MSAPAGAKPFDPASTALVVVDVQEAFRPAIRDFSGLVERIERLLEAARILGLRTLVTEQYPAGLGATVEELTAKLDEGVPRLEKLSFSATGAPGFDLDGRTNVILCGIETHICVHQTAQALLADGAAVHLLVDAVSSRTELNHSIGVERMKQSGALASSVEMVLFELLGSAESEHFRAVQRLVK